MILYNHDLIIDFKATSFELHRIGNDNEEDGFEFAGTDPQKNSSGVQDASNLWDRAHAYKRSNANAGYTEPNISNVYKFEFAGDDAGGAEGLFNNDTPNVSEYDSAWPFPINDSRQPIPKIWHLGDNFSQLKSARDVVKTCLRKIRIAHFDTGYDPAHVCYNDAIIRHDLERNFVDSDTARSAVDRFSEGLLRMPGHGTGTLSILAGAVTNLPQYDFNDSIGLNTNIEIIPIRLSKSVVLFKTSAFAEAVEYIISLYDNPATRCHIISMSMGGTASKRWADVVNEAYEKGIFIVSAAGNNFGRSTPRTIVYPARFNRVVAACGVTHDYSPYCKSFAIQNMPEMQGNFGPRKVMASAIAAFTPNVPWAKIGSRDGISLSGAGTSAATPQVAAAAALYYMKYHDEIESFDQGWKKVEAIRKAMFSTALNKISGDDNDVEIYFGNGILQARDMLSVAPEEKSLRKSEKDSVFFPLLFQILSELNPYELWSEEKMDLEEQEMFETEILQLIQDSAALQTLLENEEKTLEQLTPEQQLNFFQLIRDMPEASTALKEFIKNNIQPPL